MKVNKIKNQLKEKRKKKIKESLYNNYKKLYEYYMKENTNLFEKEKNKINKIVKEGVALGMSKEEILKIIDRVYDEKQGKRSK
jgi:hypothetical protein